MTAKQYLRQAYRLNELINSDLKELAQLKGWSTSISSSNLSGMPPSSTRNTEPSFVKCINKIVDLEKIINDEIDRFVELKKEIREVVNNVPDPDERLVLRCRYIEFLTWEQVAERMNYSIKQIHRIHSKALKNVVVPKS